MANWGDDYSLMIHSIEGHLSELISASPIPESRFTSAQKRQRLSIGSTSSVVLAEDDEDFSPNKSMSYQNADNRKLTAKLDESHLLNERLKEKLEGSVEELAKYKERTAKQLVFMESENIQLKKESTAMSDRYYDEKQKWQASMRTAESEIAKLTRRGKQVLLHLLFVLS